MSSIDLPSEYDVIVLGTGMTESIVAAALSRAGMSVLHLDRYDYYSGDWACFHFQGLQEWIKSKQDPSASELIQVKPFEKNLLGDGETKLDLTVNLSSVRNVQQKIYIREDPVVTPPAVCERKSANKDNVKSNEETCVTQCAETTQQGSSDNVPCTDEDTRSKVSDITPKEEGGGQGEGTCETSDKQGVANIEENVKTSICETSESGEEVKGKDPEDVKTKTCEAPDKCEGKESEGENGGNVKTKTCETRDKCEGKESEGGSGGNVKTKMWVFSEMKKLWRKFNIDLMPKVLFCRGPMVELLISSDVAKYCEFRTVSRVLTKLNGKLEQVPCSRSDVFGSKLVSMIEKRMMMKFLTFCLEYEKHEESYHDFKDRPYKEYLQSQKLTPNIQHFIQHSIAMVTDETSTLEGLKSTQTFIQSLGRYGNTAFLWPMYGSGELPQCFCRMCAVFGGVYCLRRTAQAMLVNSQNKCHAVVDTEGQRLQTKWLVLEAGFAGDSLISPSPPALTSYTCRAVLVTDRSVGGPLSSQDHITLLSLPVPGLQSPVTVLELPPSASCSPSSLYLVHLSCVCTEGAETDLKPVIDDLFVRAEQEDSLPQDCPKPRILWAVYFEVADTTQCSKKPETPDNVYVVGGPNHCLDFAYSVDKARRIFSDICPDQEFLPKAPNPEDIIWDDGGQGDQATGGGFSEEAEASVSEETVRSEKTEEAGEDKDKKETRSSDATTEDEQKMGATEGCSDLMEETQMTESSGITEEAGEDKDGQEPQLRDAASEGGNEAGNTTESGDIKGEI